MTTLPEGYWRATVLRTHQLSSVMRRIVLGGDGLADYRSSGASDEWLRIMVPQARQTTVELPRRSSQHWAFANPQPAPRWYTVRRWDPDRHELTIDLVIHAHGLATRWAEQVEPGDQVIVSQPHGRFAGIETNWMLIIADQTGLPAACRIIENLPAGQRAHALFEAPEGAATFTPSSQADLKVCWLYNPRPAAIASPLNVAARNVELPTGEGYVWMAGEAGSARDIRRYVRHELKWRSSRYDIVGYWRTNADAYQQRYSQIQDQVASIYEWGQASGRDQEAILDDVIEVMESQGL